MNSNQIVNCNSSKLFLYDELYGFARNIGRTDNSKW
jgi:hypothetical protein